ncbi:hypothetical protein C8A01DRAFT_36125 [Parachaetomium inaequale]|uniref:Nonribosomal peptide synthetase 12 n=1 Tax=Parachaetomium inaequale TaxID=2588326 RepID=A0AAN6PFY4_9PEZI|nr:hypothetical protein C8A01DRAFT_36125 [Parachaetomium inaequale]
MPIHHYKPRSNARLEAALPPPPTRRADEDVSDCESDCSDADSSTPPVRNSFLGVRTSIVRAPRDLEEAGADVNSSSNTLVGTPQLDAKEFKPKALLPESDPFESHGLDSSPLPPKKGPRFYRYLRWNFGSVYRRIFCLVYLANMAAMAVLIARHAISGEAFKFTYQEASLAVTANLLAAILVRNEHVVNAMFWVFGTWTKNLPLRLRTLVAKVYSYGGIHSAGAVAATFWYTAYLVLLTMEFQSAASLSVVRSYIYFVSYFILLLLVSMLVSAHPHLRRVMHNWFEGIHRFMGWLAVLLFWAQVMLLTADSTQASGTPFGRALLVSPNFWMLTVITLLVIYPWTRLRLRDVQAEVLSEHCVKLNFNYRNVHYGQAIRLTDAPLKETHAFGVIPFPAAQAAPSTSTVAHCPGCTCHTTDTNPESEKVNINTLAAIKSHTLTTPAPAPPHSGQQGFSVLVSNAGDWTRNLIAHPPRQIYTRGTPQFGVLRVAGLFAPCVIVATGSGIAPCLSLFVQHPGHPVRIIWATRDPVKTYGREVVELVYRTDPRAVVIDTGVKGKGGRPDLVRLAYRVWEEGREVVPGAGKRRGEAVVVISNQRVTRKVVYGLESRGVAAYGAIFDS